METLSEGVRAGVPCLNTELWNNMLQDRILHLDCHLGEALTGASRGTLQSQAVYHMKGKEGTSVSAVAM